MTPSGTMNLNLPTTMNTMKRTPCRPDSNASNHPPAAPHAKRFGMWQSSTDLPGPPSGPLWRKRQRAGAVQGAGALTLALGLLCCLLFLPSARAQSSAASISFQGVLNGANGQPLANGSYDLTFRFYTNATTAVALGVTNVTNVAVSGGVASAAVPVQPAWFDGQTLYLGISVNGGAELAPRVVVTAVPYALRASALSGRLGIGTASPSNEIEIRTDHPSIILQSTNDPRAEVDGRWQIEADESGGLNFIRREGTGFELQKSLWLSREGGMGFGTRTPYEEFHVQSEHPSLVLQSSIEPGSMFGAYWQIEADELGGLNFLRRHTNDLLLAQSLFFTRHGELGIGARPSTRLDVNGTTRTRVLQITGGSDLAEPFEVTSPSPDTQVAPGMVMVIDRERDGKLTPCVRAYDTAVAGVLSGANGLQPGMVMQAEGQPHAAGEHPLAMTGRVWCLADAAQSPIQRGDRLTTSPTVGHAMKVVDLTRADGAVIGKAMTELESGTGLVLVLVNLQ